MNDDLVERLNSLAAEMQEAVDADKWAGATKTQRGQLIANSWPVGMATAVCRSMLVLLARERGIEIAA